MLPPIFLWLLGASAPTPGRDSSVDHPSCLNQRRTWGNPIWGSCGANQESWRLKADGNGPRSGAATNPISGERGAMSKQCCGDDKKDRDQGPGAASSCTAGLPLPLPLFSLGHWNQVTTQSSLKTQHGGGPWNREGTSGWMSNGWRNELAKKWPPVFSSRLHTQSPSGLPHWSPCVLVEPGHYRAGRTRWQGAGQPEVARQASRCLWCPLPPAWL